MKRLLDLNYYLLLGLLLLMPFHALITTQLGSGQQGLIDGWKELIVAVMVGVTAIAVVFDQRLGKWLWRQKLIWLILAFGMLNLVYVLIFNNSFKAELLGLRTNLLFLALFVAALVAAMPRTAKVISPLLIKIICAVAVIVSLFGIVQAFFPTWLAQYVRNSEFTHSPYLFVQDAGIIRINSSLWGPSQLASYLVLPICLAFWQRLTTKRLLWSVALAPMLVALFATHSRAAWTGTLIGMVGLLAWHFRQRLTTKLVVFTILGGLIFSLIGGIAILKTNTALTYLVYHSRSDRALTQSSNTDRLLAINEGLTNWRSQPLGAGPGTAGPASTYNFKVLYTESYYVQLLVELGLAGLGIFLAISYAVGRRLYRSVQTKPLALPLLAAFGGLVLMNLVHHTWSDATTAIVWWGSAGALLGAKP